MNLDGDDLVTLDEYIMVKSYIQEFNVFAIGGETTRANLHEAEYTEAEFIFYDADTNDAITLAEYLAGELVIENALKTVFDAYFAADAVLALAAETLPAEELTMTVWTAIGESEDDFT